MNAIDLEVWFAPEYSAPHSACSGWRLVERRHATQALAIEENQRILLLPDADRVLRAGTLMTCGARKVLALDMPSHVTEAAKARLDGARCFRLPAIRGEEAAHAHRRDGKLSTAEALAAAVNILGAYQQAAAICETFSWGDAFMLRNFGRPIMREPEAPSFRLLNHFVSCAVAVFAESLLAICLMGSGVHEQPRRCEDLDVLVIVDDGTGGTEFDESQFVDYLRGGLDSDFLRVDDFLARRLTTELKSKECDLDSFSWQFGAGPQWQNTPGISRLHLHVFGPMPRSCFLRYQAECPVFATHMLRTCRVLAGGPLHAIAPIEEISKSDVLRTLDMLEKRLKRAATRLQVHWDTSAALAFLKSYVGIATTVAVFLGEYTDDKRTAIQIFHDCDDTCAQYKQLLTKAYELKVSHHALAPASLHCLVPSSPGLLRAARQVITSSA